MSPKRMVGECMKKDFIVRRSITMVEGKPHVITYSEQELIRCKDCKHFSPERIYMCRIHGSMFQPKDRNWFCADGEHKSTQTNAKNNVLDVR